MSMQPGEPPAGPGTAAAAEAARDTDDPGALQVDLEEPAEQHDDTNDTVGGLAPGVHETDKPRRAAT